MTDLIPPHEPEHSPLGRRGRSTTRAQAFIPRPLGTQRIALTLEAEDEASEALAVLARADERIGASHRRLIPSLVRAEGIASARLQGFEAPTAALMAAELNGAANDAEALIINTVRASHAAMGAIADPDLDVTLTGIEDLRTALAPESGDAASGIRDEHPLTPRADGFVPPPARYIRPLMDDLAEYLTATDGNPIVRAALAHAQFTAIHPFTSANGRLGRALVHTSLVRSDVLRNMFVPMSTAFAANAPAYRAGLAGFRQGQLSDWVIDFARAVEVSASKAVRLVEASTALDAQLRDALIAYRTQQGLSPASPRQGAVIWRVLESLVVTPGLTIESVAAREGASRTAAQQALNELDAAGILTRRKFPNRVVYWTAEGHLALLARIVGGAPQAPA